MSVNGEDKKDNKIKKKKRKKKWRKRHNTIFILLKNIYWYGFINEFMVNNIEKIRKNNIKTLMQE